MTPHSEAFVVKLTIDQPTTVCDVLAGHCNLSKSKIKQALNKGAAVLTRHRQKNQRIRKGGRALFPGDVLTFSYDPRILAVVPPEPELLFSFTSYSVWFKPSGLLSQGTPFGDHCSLNRFADLYFGSKIKVKLVHRLDRDAAGVVLLCHTRETASYFSRLFATGGIIKQYIACVSGTVDHPGKSMTISAAIDGKRAKTILKVREVCGDHSILEIEILTGRKHQIRKHLQSIGHPIVGDRLYGAIKSTGASGDLKLMAVRLSFSCPEKCQSVEFGVPKETVNTFLQSCLK